MICPSVPDEQMIPVASFGSYPALSIDGRLSSPIVTTVAPTIPVEAASTAPTAITEIPSPPRIWPNSRPIVSSSCSAMRERSSITPIKTNSGTATRTSFDITPK